VTDDTPTTAEIWRAFTDFRGETRDQYKFVVRLLIGGIASAVIGNIAAAVFIVLASPKP
jgi:hypothetical protein